MKEDWLDVENDIPGALFYAGGCADYIHSICTELNTNHANRWYLLDKINSLENCVSGLKGICREVENEDTQT